MPRGKDAPTQVGGQIDPYVQRSIQQSKQLAESRLVAAMQESGATGRAQIAAASRPQGDSGLAVARERSAGALALADKRAAEDERARREDQEFTKTMTKVNHELRAKEAELERAMRVAQTKEAREDAREIADRQLSLDKLRAVLGERAQVRNTNVQMSLIKGMKKSEANEERTKSAMFAESDEFDENKGKYERAKESLVDAIANDKRMDGMIPRTAWDVYTGGKDVPVSTLGFTSPVAIGYRFYKERKKIKEEGLADPIGVLQDQITKREGKISVEDLSSANIHRIEEQIQAEDIKTEDINETFGAVDAMLEAIDEKRRSVDKKSSEFDFWNNQHITISQFKRNLIGLEDSDKKIKGSETQTVGKTILYALRTIRDGSLGNRVSRYKAIRGDGNIDGLYEEVSKSLDPYEPLPITEDMNKYDIENYTWFNETIVPLYQQSENEGVE